jgi:hypothetical protein
MSLYPIIQTNPNKNNDLYKKIVDILKKDNSVYELVDYLKDNNIFNEETYIGESYDGTIYRIPLSEWNEKTEMNIVIDETKYYQDSVPILDSLLEAYCGTIHISTNDDKEFSINDNKENRKHFVCICGSA